MGKHSYEYVKNYLFGLNLSLNSKNYDGQWQILDLTCLVCSKNLKTQFTNIRYREKENKIICSFCAKLEQEQKSLERFKKAIENKNGKLLEHIYRGYKEPHLVQCAIEFHNPWNTTPDKVFAGRWCPECSSGLAEQVFRLCFEQSFGKRFPKARPSWLVSDRGNRLELDGFCEELNLAFEYNGVQHYKKLEFFDNNPRASFNDRVRNDKKKKKLCAENNIKLVIIPYIDDNNILNYAVDRFREICKEYELSPNFSSINLTEIFSTMGDTSLLEQIKEICKGKNGVCLSECCQNTASIIKVRCEKGHEWEPCAGRILAGHWCKKCVKNFTYHEETFKDIKEKFNIKLLNLTKKCFRRAGKWQCLNCNDTFDEFIFIIYKNGGCMSCLKEERRESGYYSEIYKKTRLKRKSNYPVKFIMSKILSLKEFLTLNKNNIQCLSKVVKFKNISNIKAFVCSLRVSYKKETMPQVVINKLKKKNGWIGHPQKKRGKF